MKGNPYFFFLLLSPLSSSWSIYTYYNSVFVYLRWKVLFMGLSQRCCKCCKKVFLDSDHFRMEPPGLNATVAGFVLSNYALYGSWHFCFFGWFGCKSVARNNFSRINSIEKTLITYVRLIKKCDICDMNQIETILDILIKGFAIGCYCLCSVGAGWSPLYSAHFE